MEIRLSDWERDDDISGEAAGMFGDGRVLDLVVTSNKDGDEVKWDVVDGMTIIAFDTASSVPLAKQAAVVAARRAFMRAV